MRDTSRQPLARAITGLALPAALSFLLQNLYHQNDAWFIGKVGGAATSAMMPVTMVAVANFGVFLTLARGTQSLVARTFGAGDLEGVQRALGQGLRLAMLAVLPMAALEWVYARELLALMGGEGAALDAGVTYLRMLVCFMPCLFAMPLIDFSIQGLGDTKTPFKLQLLAVGVNTALNFMLVLPHDLSWGGEGLRLLTRTGSGGTLVDLSLPLALPLSGSVQTAGMGVAGAAAATGLSRGFVALLGLTVLIRGKGLRLLLTRAMYRHDRRRAGEILRVGVPAGSSTFLFAVVGMFITGLVGRFGQDALGGYYVGFRAIESAAFMVVLGFGVGAGTVAAHAVGAGDFARARAAGHMGALLCAVPMLAATLLFLLVPELLASPFSDRPGILAAAAAYLGTMAWCQLPQSMEMVYGDVMASSGSSVRSALVSIPGNVLRIPLAFGAVAMGWGLAGIWWAIVATAVLKGLGMAALFRSRSWDRAVLSGRERVLGAAASAGSARRGAAGAQLESPEEGTT